MRFMETLMTAKARLEFPLHNRFMCEGVDVWITHIGGYPGKYNPAIKAEMAASPPKLFISGHSHILKVMFDKKHTICTAYEPRSLRKKWVSSSSYHAPLCD